MRRAVDQRLGTSDGVPPPWRGSSVGRGGVVSGVFRQGAAVSVVCFPAAAELPGGILQGRFQPEPGYEREDEETVSVCTPVLRDGWPRGQASALAVVKNNGDGLKCSRGRLFSLFSLFSQREGRTTDRSGPTPQSIRQSKRAMRLPCRSPDSSGIHVREKRDKPPPPEPSPGAFLAFIAG